MDFTNYDNNSNKDKSYDIQLNKYNPYASTQGPLFPSYLYLMDNFNHRLFTIFFEGSWLSSLKSVDLNYQNTSETEVTSSFDLKFYKFHIQINDDMLKNIFPNI